MGTPHIITLPDGRWANVGLCPAIGGRGWATSVVSVGEAWEWIGGKNESA